VYYAYPSTSPDISAVPLAATEVVVIARRTHPRIGRTRCASVLATGVESAIRALDAGASGYVLKGSSTTELLTAIASVQSGETYITQNFANRVIAGLRDASLRRKAVEIVILSIREQQIVRLLMSGKTNKEIAIAIKISEKTVKHYITTLMQKLHVRNRVEVVIAAQKLHETERPVLHS
jgi:two-component system, NarL family, nitrate/nitrite response regulator NarL